MSAGTAQPFRYEQTVSTCLKGRRLCAVVRFRFGDVIWEASVLQAMLQIVQIRLVDLYGERGCHELKGVCPYRRQSNSISRVNDAQGALGTPFVSFTKRKQFRSEIDLLAG